MAERAFLKTLEGGCQVPIGGAAVVEGENVTLTGFVGSLNGKTSFRESMTGSISSRDELGTDLAERLIELGAREILDDARDDAKAATETPV